MDRRRTGGLFGIAMLVAACGGAPLPEPLDRPPPTARPRPPPIPPPGADQRVFAHPSGVRFDVPEAWTSEIDDDSMSLVSADESAMLMFFVVDASNLEAALLGLRETLAGVVDEPEMAKGAERDLNGLPTYAARGEGMLKGTPVSLALAVVQTPSGRMLIVLGIADQQAPEVTVAQIEATVTSLRPHEP